MITALQRQSPARMLTSGGGDRLASASAGAPADPILELTGLHKRFGNVAPADDFSVTIRRGEFFTMLGPSGSGKSTILRMIAGLEFPDSGSIRVEGRELSHTPPWERGLGMVFQNYAIFPHMNVGQNVSYGLRKQRVPAAEREKRVGELLSMVGLEGFAERSVGQLSGGEQQRVAVARALAPRPQILLLDEPLSALDEKIRREMQDELRTIQRRTGTTFVYVTHDQEEALTMSDRIAVLNGGRYVQCDAPETIFMRPRTQFVARFFRGCNVLSADLTERAGKVVARIAGQEVVIDPLGRRLGSGRIAVRSEAVRLDAPSDAALALTATVESIVYHGVYTTYHLRLGDGQPIVATQSQRGSQSVGAKVGLAIEARDLIMLEPD